MASFKAFEFDLKAMLTDAARVDCQLPACNNNNFFTWIFII